MEQKEKELLIIDLCGRLPYGVKAYIKNWSKIDRKYYEGTYTIESMYPSINEIFATSDNGSVKVIVGYDDYEIKPYLFPMSSLNIFINKYKDEWDNILKLEIEDVSQDYISTKGITANIEFFNKCHLDYRGLIEKGLAIDATILNIY